MSKKGWIKLHRSLLASSEWCAEPFTRGQAWVDLLLLAAHRDRRLKHRGQELTIARGQVARSINWIALRWGWSRGKVKRQLIIWKDRISLEKNGQKTDTHNGQADGHPDELTIALLSIINYDAYQNTDRSADTPDGQKVLQHTRSKEEYKKRPAFQKARTAEKKILYPAYYRGPK